MRVSEICVQPICVNQGLGVLSPAGISTLLQYGETDQKKAEQF